MKTTSKTVLGILVVFAVALFAGCVADELTTEQNSVVISDHPDTPNQTPLPTIVPTPEEKVQPQLIDEISWELNRIEKEGWNNLYEEDIFDCSRMTTFLWDYLRQKYKVPPKLIVSNELHHAWIGLRVSDVGDSEHPKWSINGVEYYYVECTVPKVAEYEDVSFYASKQVFVCDDPGEATELARRWSSEFRLRQGDLEKISLIVGDYKNT